MSNILLRYNINRNKYFKDGEFDFDFKVFKTDVIKLYGYESHPLADHMFETAWAIAVELYNHKKITSILLKQTVDVFDLLDIYLIKKIKSIDCVCSD